MNRIPIESKDLSVLTGLKPFLSPRGQELVDMMVSIVRIFNSQEEGLDTEALSTLIELLQRED